MTAELPRKKITQKYGKKAMRSAILDEEYIDGNVVSSYSRKEILEFLHENSDNNGVVLMFQKDAAEALGMDVIWLSKIIRDLCDVGYMETSGRGKNARMSVLHHPDDCDWGPVWQARDRELRKRWLSKKRQQKYQEGDENDR